MASILHVERSSFFQKIVRDILKSRGFIVLNSSSIAESLEILRRETVDLMITSLELDDGKGQDLIRLASEQGIARPTVVVTASESLSLRQELFALGVADYLIKQDLNEQRLLSYVQNLIDTDPILERMRTMHFAALDDSRLSLQVIENIFKMHGLPNLRLYSHPQELLDTRDNFDMVIIDLVMPDMNGEDVVRTLRQSHPETMIVVASSINHSKTVSHVLDSGADDYITKPFDGQLFMARLKSTIRSWLMLEDIRQQKTDLQRLARTDSLTGLLNHGAILAALDAEIERRKQDPRHQLALFLLDIDDFKQLNDKHGHQTGDEVLQGLARHLERHVPAQSHVGRYGGEEFLVVLSGLDPDKARGTCTAMLETLRQEPIGSKQLAVRFSAGLVMHRDETASQLFATADAALYHAKQSGKNQIIEAAS